jgi:hypothetical protein
MITLPFAAETVVKPDAAEPVPSLARKPKIISLEKFVTPPAEAEPALPVLPY